MTEERRAMGSTLTLSVALLLLLVTGGWLAFGAGEPISGPRPIVWDEEVCAECRMHIGDRMHAAQLQSESGEVLSFDDIGCLLRYQETSPSSRATVYFRNALDDGWLSLEGAEFLDGRTTPMGYGLGAVPRGTPGAMGLEDARLRVAGRAEAMR